MGTHARLIDGTFRLCLFKKEEVLNVEQTKYNQTQVRTNTEKFNFEKLVLACGAFSKKLTDQLGENIPLDTERGYHVHYKDVDHLLKRPVIFLDRGFVVKLD